MNDGYMASNVRGLQVSMQINAHFHAIVKQLSDRLRDSVSGNMLRRKWRLRGAQWAQRVLFFLEPKTK